MTNSNSRPRIGVFGHYGNNNLGDESTIFSILDKLKKIWPEAQLSCFSINPADSAKRYGVAAWPIRYLSPDSGERAADHPTGDAADEKKTVEATNPANEAGIKSLIKSIPIIGSLVRLLLRSKEVIPEVITEIGFLKQAFGRLKNLDILMVTGSNQFLDNFGGPWGFPYTLWKWSLLARWAGVKVMFISVGAGPIDNALSRWFLRRAVRHAIFLSFRDKGSQELMESLGVKMPSYVYPDLSHGIKRTACLETVAVTGESGRLSVGINTMPVYDKRYWCDPDDDQYRIYVDKLVELTNRLTARDVDVCFFSTQPKDDDVADDVMERLNNGRVTAVRCKTAETNHVSLLLDTICSFDIVFATRFHGSLLSLALEKPVIAISYHKKIASLMREMGQSQYSMVFEDVTVDQLEEKFLALADEKLQATERIRLANRRMADALEEQYQKIESTVNESL